MTSRHVYSGADPRADVRGAGDPGSPPRRAEASAVPQDEGGAGAPVGRARGGEKPAEKESTKEGRGGGGGGASKQHSSKIYSTANAYGMII